MVKLMEYDSSQTRYAVKILTAAGEVLDLSQVMTACSWEDPSGEVAARATLSFVDFLTEKDWLTKILTLATCLFIFANEKEVFRGVIWDWDYTCADKKEVAVTAYDRMIYATQSKDNSYYTAGKSTKAIVEDICGRWGIKVQYSWDSHTHSKIVYKNKTIAAQIMETLEETARGRESRYTAYMAQDTLLIQARGSNPDVCLFDSRNTLSLRHKRSLSKLVTKVMILGKEDAAGRLPVEAIVTGETKYGTLQEIINRDCSRNLSDAKAEADELLHERGKPDETIHLQTPDIPFLRKGDRIKVHVGTVYQTYLFVKGVTHDGVSRTMSLECER